MPAWAGTVLTLVIALVIAFGLIWMFPGQPCPAGQQAVMHADHWACE